MKTIINILLKLSVKNGIFLFLTTLSFFLSTTAKGNDLPLLDITLMAVPEKHACQPNGYASYESEAKSNCIKLTADDIKFWKELDFVCILRQVPPKELSLGDTLFGLLDAYRTASKSDPEYRQSFVLLFDWKTPQYMDLNFKRIILNKIGVPFPELSWSGKMDGERRWIHHERADAFLPAYNVRWVLEAGGNKWILKSIR